jgi:hypothetical protein
LIRREAQIAVRDEIHGFHGRKMRGRGLNIGSACQKCHFERSEESLTSVWRLTRVHSQR